MELIDATYFSSYTFETKKWKTIKGGFTHFADGDIAFAKITPCFQNRKSMILRNLPNGIGAGTTELKVLRPYAKTINDFYLLFFLESAYFVEQATFKGTANQQRIISGYMENKLFPLPPINEQERITEKLKTLLLLADKYGESQIALNKLNDELPKLMKQSILQEAIQGRLVSQDPNDEPVIKLLERIRMEKQALVKQGKLKAKDITDSIIYKGDDNKYYEQIGSKRLEISEEIPFDIPDSWAWSRLAQLAALISGTSYNKGDVCKEGIRILRGGNIQETKLLTYDNDVFLPYSYADENKQIRIDDIIIVGSTGSKEVIGKPAFITAQCADTQIGAFLRIVRPYFSYYASYLQILFSTNYYRRHIQTKVKGTNINNIKAEYIANLLVPIPPQKEMERIVAKKEELYSKL